MSARTQPEDVAAGLALASDYLTKPFLNSELARAVDRAVEKVRAAAAEAEAAAAALRPDPWRQDGLTSAIRRVRPPT